MNYFHPKLTLPLRHRLEYRAQRRLYYPSNRLVPCADLAHHQNVHYHSQGCVRQISLFEGRFQQVRDVLVVCKQGPLLHAVLLPHLLRHMIVFVAQDFRHHRAENLQVVPYSPHCERLLLWFIPAVAVVQ